MDDVEATLLATLSGRLWEQAGGEGAPPPEFVERVRGTFMFQAALLRARWRAVAAAVKEAARWN